MKHVGAIVALAGLFASTAVVAAVPQGRESVSIAVTAAGLDLATPQGVAQLRARVGRAVAQACNPGDRLKADMTPDWQCRREMAAGAEPVVAQLVAQSSARSAHSR